MIEKMELTLDVVKEKLSSGEYKTIPNPTKSDVWNALGIVVLSLTQQEVAFVASNKCKHILKWKQGNCTLTMLRHRNSEGVPTDTRRIPPTSQCKGRF